MFYYELISVLDCYVKKLNKRILFTKSIDASHNARFKLGVWFLTSSGIIKCVFYNRDESR